MMHYSMALLLFGMDMPMTSFESLTLKGKKILPSVETKKCYNTAASTSAVGDSELT